ncbi:MAG: hypothetical protein AAFN77_04580 [Planctomycetota bacterium]
MSRPHNSNRLLAHASILIVAVLLAGCETISRPWAGVSYQPPNTGPSPGQSIYHPTPEILPARLLAPTDSTQSDAEIERLLFGIEADQGDQ